MSRETIIKMLTETARNVVPTGSKVVLFGSQARGDANEESDWDILVLLDSQRVLLSDYDNIAYPIRAAGWDVDAIVNPILYTKTDWQNNSNTLFYKNVTKDGIVLWG